MHLPSPKNFISLHHNGFAITNKARHGKRQAERLWHKFKTPFTRSHFRKQINFGNNIFFAAKCRYYTEKINNVKDNQKKLWKDLKNILHKNPVSILPESSSLKCLADSFAKFFANKITHIRSSFSNTPHVFVDFFPPPLGLL